MLLLTRERINQHLFEVNALVDLYQDRDSNFVPNVVKWLSKLEENLKQLRSPLSSFVAAERARILAVYDGLRDPRLNDPKTTKRKAGMATASLALNGTVEKMHAVLAEIDEKFAVWREKMSQLLALASMRKPIPFPPTEPRQDWLKKVWRQLGESAEARGMHVYLNATMAVSDRLQLLDELIMNLVPDAPPVTLEC